MNKQTKIIGALLGAALATASGVAVAESTYGYQSSGTGTVQANAQVNLKVTVPKLILLRVGSSNTVDEISWAGTASWTALPAAIANGDNQAADWNGAAPSFNFTTTNNALAVYAWHNNGSGGGAALTFTGTAITPSGGPALSDITASNTAGTPAHPGGTLGTATTVNLTSNTLYSGTWTYTLGGTPASWLAGVYQGSVLYTATTL